MLHSPHRLPIAQRESSLLRTIHHSNKRDWFHCSVVTIPHMKFGNHQANLPTSTTNRDLHLTEQTLMTPCPSLSYRTCFRLEMLLDVANNDKLTALLLINLLQSLFLLPAQPSAAVKQMGRYIFAHPERR